MKRRSLIGFAASGLAVAYALVAAAPALAHHSFGAEYDGNKPITLTGVVTVIQWTNPHFYFFVDVKDKNGLVANWKFEGYPPGVLTRIGWKRDVTMRPGDTVTVFGWRARDGTNWAHSREVTFKDGRKLFTYRWEGATPGEHTLVSRATDMNGTVQPAAAELSRKKTFLEDNGQFPRKVMIS